MKSICVVLTYWCIASGQNRLQANSSYLFFFESRWTSRAPRINYSNQLVFKLLLYIKIKSSGIGIGIRGLEPTSLFLSFQSTSFAPILDFLSCRDWLFLGFIHDWVFWRGATTQSRPRSGWDRNRRQASNALGKEKTTFMGPGISYEDMC